MNFRLNRRVVTTTLIFTPYGGREAYWGERVRYREGKRIYSLSFGIVWLARQ